MHYTDFLRTALKDYKQVGALFASSRYAIQHVVSHIQPKHRFVVEYGAGDGAITKAILERLPKEGKIVAIELNCELAEQVKKIQDERLTVVEGDVVTLAKHLEKLGLPEIHVVVSGIPYSFLKQEIREQVVCNTHAQLAEDGTFVVYQNSLLMLPLLKKYFDRCRVSFEPRNIFPYFIMTAQK